MTLTELRTVIERDNGLTFSAWLCENRLRVPQLGFISELMDGCQHVHYHHEGDVLTHTLLVIDRMSVRPHDWIDILCALLHDVGKKEALEANGGKNMHGHEIYGESIARDILLGMNADSDVTETVCFVVRNHTMANDLVKCKSKYDCWKLIQCPLFPRLRRLAVADAAGTYGPDMAPIVDYEAELANSVAGFCLANPMPEPLMTVDDLVERGVNPDDIPDMLDMCHKIQVNGNVTKKNSIIGNAIKNLAMSTQSVAENARNLKKRENLFIFF